MAKWLSDDGELEKLNEFVSGKTVDRIEYDDLDDIEICFSDGSSVVISTLGGIEISKFRRASIDGDAPVL